MPYVRLNRACIILPETRWQLGNLRGNEFTLYEFRMPPRLCSGPMLMFL